MHHLPSRYIPCDGRLTASAYFDPRSPHGERPVRQTVYPNPPQFQSTPPAWGATGGFPLGFYGVSISIHPPRMGSDSAFSSHTPSQNDFNPRSPWGERRLAGRGDVSDIDFNPRSPWGGATFF